MATAIFTAQPTRTYTHRCLVQLGQGGHGRPPPLPAWGWLHSFLVLKLSRSRGKLLVAFHPYPQPCVFHPPHKKGESTGSKNSISLICFPLWGLHFHIGSFQSMEKMVTRPLEDQLSNCNRRRAFVFPKHLLTAWGWLSESWSGACVQLCASHDVWEMWVQRHWPMRSRMGRYCSPERWWRDKNCVLKLLPCTLKTKSFSMLGF